MNKYTTTLLAIDAKDGQIKQWVGEIIEAPSFELAEQWLQLNGKGYLTISGKLISTVDEQSGNKISFENLN
jgi:hypothetical protein